MDRSLVLADSRHARSRPRQRRYRSHLLGAPRHRQPRRQRHPPQSTAGARIAMKKLTLSSYQYVAAHNAVQLIEINRLSDRHFWHEDYDKASIRFWKIERRRDMRLARASPEGFPGQQGLP